MLKKSIFFLAVSFTKLLKLTKVIKLLLAAATLGSYAYLFTWQFGVVIMFTIGIHEMGHILAMKYYGIPTKGFYFLPFLGGVAVGDSTNMNLSEKTKYAIALFGPIVTLVQTVALFLIFYCSGGTNATIGGIASFSAMILMVNLLPVLPLDGGQIFSTISRSLVAGISMFLSLSVNAFFVVIASKSGAHLLAFFCMLGCLELLIGILHRANESNYSHERKGTRLADFISVTKFIVLHPVIVDKPLTKNGITLGLLLYISIFLAGVYVIQDLGQYPDTKAALMLLEDK